MRKEIIPAARRENNVGGKKIALKSLGKWRSLSPTVVFHLLLCIFFSKDWWPDHCFQAYFLPREAVIKVGHQIFEKKTYAQIKRWVVPVTFACGKERLADDETKDTNRFIASLSTLQELHHLGFTILYLCPSFFHTNILGRAKRKNKSKTKENDGDERRKSTVTRICQWLPTSKRFACEDFCSWKLSLTFLYMWIFHGGFLIPCRWHFSLESFWLRSHMLTPEVIEVPTKE